MPPCDDEEPLFRMHLLAIRNVDARAEAVLQGTGAHVTGSYWLVEAELGALETAGVEFEYMGSAVMPGYGGMSPEEIRDLAREAFPHLSALLQLAGADARALDL